MTPYMHDGIEFDLDRTYKDVTDVEWAWTGARNTVGEPLMISLPHYHGPLIPMPQPTTASTYRRILAQGTAA